MWWCAYGGNSKSLYDMIMLLGSLVKGGLLMNFIGQDYDIHGNN